MVSYQFRYSVHDDVGGCTSITYFHTTMWSVNKKKKKYFVWFCYLFICLVLVNYLFSFFLRDALSAFQLSTPKTENKNKCSTQPCCPKVVCHSHRQSL